VETAGDLRPALKTALDSGLPTVIDVPVAAAAQPSAATWDLPPLPHPEPSFGWPDPANPPLSDWPDPANPATE
jgi:acetolactate synthase-1/2/3 large subunit